jgi:hypothetical protein
MLNDKRASLLDRKFVKSLMMIYLNTCWWKLKKICMSNVQSGLYKFPWKRKTWKLQVTSWGLVKSMPDYGLWYITEDSFFTFPLWLLPSEPGRSERRTWGRVSPRCFLHGENICRKVVTEHVFWLLLEHYWRGVYCPLQTNELQKEVLLIFSHFCCVIAWSYFRTAFLPPFFEFLMFISTWKKWF